VSPGIIAGVDFGNIFVVSEPAANQEHDDRRPLVTQLLACTSYLRRPCIERCGEAAQKTESFPTIFAKCKRVGRLLLHRLLSAAESQSGQTLTWICKLLQAGRERQNPHAFESAVLPN
jgi:hypothetical protein